MKPPMFVVYRASAKRWDVLMNQGNHRAARYVLFCTTYVEERAVRLAMVMNLNEGELVP